MTKSHRTVDGPVVPLAASDSLTRYGEPLLRTIATQFSRPRLQWSAAEMREKIVAALGDSASIDRMLKSVSPPARRVLKLLGLSRQLRWRIADLDPFVRAATPGDGESPIAELLSCGLLIPELTSRAAPIASIDSLLGNGSATPLVVWAMPLAASRSGRETLELPKVDFDVQSAAPREVDGLEWPLRLAGAWQLVRDTPLRLTQARGLFKRDLDRLRTHSVLSAPATDQIGPVDEPAILAVALAERIGMLTRDGEEIRAASFGSEWSDNPEALLTSIWSAYLGLDDVFWSSTFPPAIAVLALSILDQLPADQWAPTSELDSVLETFGAAPDAVAGFVLGLAYQLRLVQATQVNDRWWVRLSQFGKALMAGAPHRLPGPASEQTLLVQPNLEIVLFRQGVTPELISRLSHFAEWKSLGSACTLTLTADSVYRGMEAGHSLADILALLERHGTRDLSENVLGTLRSWASKRERVLVLPSALVIEFRTTAELDRAMREGLIEHRICDRIGVIGSESKIDYQQFRFIGSRDYLAPDEQCVEIEPHGLTVTVNENKSDLLLESELRRFAEPVERNGDDRPRYRMTLDSLRTARRQGLNAESLDAWFRRRAGEPLPPAAKLLIVGDQAAPFALATLTVLRVPTAELADGLASWPETAPLIAERLAPTLLAVPSDCVETLRNLLSSLGARLELPAE